MPLTVGPGVFNPVVHVSGAAVAKAIDGSWIPPKTRVLDLATGCGLLAIFAARHAAHVTATDSNPVAVDCAAANVSRLGLQHVVTVRCTDLLSGLGRFDVILCNPPYEIGAPPEAEGESFASADFFDRLAAALAQHLTPSGYLLMALPAGHEQPLEILRAGGLDCERFQTIPTRVADLCIWRVDAPATARAKSPSAGGGRRHEP